MSTLDLAGTTIRQQVVDHVAAQVAGITGVVAVRYRLPGSDQIRKPLRPSECPLAYVYDGPDDEQFDLDKYVGKSVNQLPISAALVDAFDPNAPNDSAQGLLRKGNRYIGVLLEALNETALDWPAVGLNVDATTPTSAFLAELATVDGGPMLIAGVQLQVAYWVSTANPCSQ